MKDTNREKHIQVRFTEPEIVKFKQVAKENGLTYQGLLDTVWREQVLFLMQVKKEL